MQAKTESWPDYRVLCPAYENEPQHVKTYLLICSPNQDSNQPTHLRSLITLFVVCLKKLAPLFNKNIA